MFEQFFRRQINFVTVRGIHNGNYGIDRWNEEGEELLSAETPQEKFEESLDTFIVNAEVLMRLGKELGMDVTQIIGALFAKMDLTEQKYSLENWDFDDVEGSIKRAREDWRLKTELPTD